MGLNSQHAIPKEVKALFWNLDPENLRAERDHDLIISTVLTRGGRLAVSLLMRTYGRATIRDFVIRDEEGLRTLPEPDRRLWLRVLAPDYRPEPSRRLGRWQITRRIPASYFPQAKPSSTDPPHE